MSAILPPFPVENQQALGFRVPASRLAILAKLHGERHERHHPRRRRRYPPLPPHPGLSKQLVPVYNKPMVYYPLSTLMLAGIRDILVITTPADQTRVRRLPGRRQPVRASSYRYAVQPEPDGLAQAFLIGARLHRPGTGWRSCSATTCSTATVSPSRCSAPERAEGATIFAYYVRDPERYGVVEFDERHVVDIEEKPSNPTLELRRHRALLLRRQRLRHHRGSAPRRAASSRSPTSTGRTCRQGRLTSSSSAAASPGWTPVRTNRCCRPRRSSRRSRSGRA